MPNDNDPFNSLDGLIMDKTTPEQHKVDYPIAYTSDIQINNILESMNVYDRNHINTQIMREKLANKLMNAAMNADLDDADAESRDVTLHLVTEARNILNDLDKAARDNVAIKLKKKDTENAEASNINMAEFLAKIKVNDMQQFDQGTIVQSADEINRNLEIIEKSKDINILDTELETGGNMLPDKPEEIDS